MKVYKRIKDYLQEKNLWEIFMYLIFGGLTTLVNIVVFYLAFSALGLNWKFANTLSWILSVLFAFITNKLWVFHSENNNLKEFIFEAGKFFAARLLSYGIDMLCMFLLIEIIPLGNLWAKLITQVVVVVLNYIFSKLFIFTHQIKTK